MTISAVAGLLWAYTNYKKLTEVDLGVEGSDEDLKAPLNSKILGAVEIGAIIREGASEFIVS